MGQYNRHLSSTNMAALKLLMLSAVVALVIVKGRAAQFFKPTPAPSNRCLTTKQYQTGAVAWPAELPPPCCCLFQEIWRGGVCTTFDDCRSQGRRCPGGTTNRLLTREEAMELLTQG